MSARRILLLRGGLSAEREGSLTSAAEVERALLGAGYEVSSLDPGWDVAETLPRALEGVDVVFNALHGKWGEDGNIQALLNFARVPYTHSGVMASSLAIDKPRSKLLFAAAGIPIVHDRPMTLAELRKGGDPLPRPYVIKPSHEGSSVGVKIVMPDSGPADLSGLETYDSLMVEDYVPGRELTVSVLQTRGQAPRALAVTELETDAAFYDYEAKYSAEAQTRHIVNPDNLPGDVHEALLRWSEAAHETLGCRGATRADFRYDPDSGRIAILEVNTQPGLTPLSLLPEQALATGMDFTTLVTWMVENAACDA